MGQLVMVAAALPMAGGPVAAAVLVLRRRPGARPSRASRRLAEELRAVADVLPRLRPLPLPARPRGPVPGPRLAHTCAVPAPRRPREQDEACALCAR